MNATYIQGNRLAEKACAASIPHGVILEGRIVGIQFVRTPLGECFFLWAERIVAWLCRKPISPSVPTVKFCNIQHIDFSNDAPLGDGQKLHVNAPVQVSNLDFVVSQALSRRLLLRSMPFNARARFFANGTLHVEFLSLA